jgi:arabinofuranosyltransferase
MIETNDRKTYLSYLLLISSAWIVFLWTLYANAWLTDDAYITLRVVDNFISGHGLRWNIAERVQAYTHPVWALVLSGICYFTKEVYFSTVITSMLISLTVYTLLVYHFYKFPVKVAFLSVILLSSKSFIDFTTSGLENPMSYLFTIIFLIFFMRKDYNAINFRVILLCYSFLLLCRPDYFLIYTPPLLYYTYNYRYHGKNILRNLLYGLAPLMLWEMFSFIYYGSLFPNTALGKLNVSIPFGAKVKQGFSYFTDSLNLDPVTLMAIIAAIILINIKMDIKHRLISLGIVLYVLYVIVIGGDFMSGRFFSVPFLIAVYVLTEMLPAKKHLATLITLLVLLVGILSPYTPFLSDIDYRLHSPTQAVNIKTAIADERGYYYRVTGLRRVLSNEDNQLVTIEMVEDVENYFPVRFIIWGLELSGEKRVTVGSGLIGLMGYFAGPDVHIIDKYALCDPLLSRMKFYAKGDFRPGHLNREIPQGYIDSIVRGENVISDPEIAKLYDRVLLLTTADLFAKERIKALVGL